MGKQLPKLWKEDREIENEENQEIEFLKGLELPKERHTQSYIVYPEAIGHPYNRKLHELSELELILQYFYSELDEIKDECAAHKRDIRLLKKELRVYRKATTVKEKMDIEERKKKSAKRALELQRKLGIQGNLSEIDGFAGLVGMLKKYSRPDETSVEFLETAREE